MLSSQKVDQLNTTRFRQSISQVDQYRARRSVQPYNSAFRIACGRETSWRRRVCAQLPALQGTPSTHVRCMCCGMPRDQISANICKYLTRENASYTLSFIKQGFFL
jgi:hypothetical protein